MGTLLLKIVFGYVEKHPDQIVELLGEATKAAVTALRQHNAAAGAAGAAGAAK